MDENIDYFSYLIGIASLFLTLISFFKEENQQLVFLVWGAAGLIVAVVMIYINKYLYKLKKIEEELTNYRKECSFTEQIKAIKEEFFKIKNGQKRKRIN